MTDEPPTAGVPRWVKVSGIIAALLVLVVVIVLLAGHDPGRHLDGLAALAGRPR